MLKYYDKLSADIPMSSKSAISDSIRGYDPLKCSVPLIKHEGLKSGKTTYTE
jgi:hypothetical protein